MDPINNIPKDLSPEEKARFTHVVRKLSVYLLSKAIKEYILKSRKIPQDAGVSIAQMLLIQVMYDRVANEDEKMKSRRGWEAFKETFRNAHPFSIEEARAYLENSIKLMNEVSVEIEMGEKGDPTST